MGIFDNFANMIADSLASRLLDDKGKALATARNYAAGIQPSQLKVRAGQFDDNITLNFVGLITDRIVSQVIGNGVELDFEGDTETESEKFIKAALDANQQEVLLHRSVKSGVLAGTGFLFMQEGSVFGNDGNEYPRITLWDSAFVTIETLPEDFEVVTSYTLKYKFINVDGKEAARKRIVKKTDILVDEAGNESGSDTWEIVDYILNNASGKWDEVDRVLWPYNFAPVIHWQNLPSLDKPEGVPDITEDLLADQDRINFVASNASKIIRFYAHPQRFSRMYGNDPKVKLAPDEMPNFADPNGGLFQLETMGDMNGILSYMKLLRQSMFDRARVIDIDSMQDKVGALTNFGLRVLYQDNINLIATHRELFGDMLEELVRRLLIIAGKPEIACDVVWPDWMPVNESEEIAAITADMAAGLLSKQTAAKKRGHNWKQEQTRLADEQTNQLTIGEVILNSFNQGGQ